MINLTMVTVQPIDFTQKTLALVTGASRGIGREICIKLSNELCEGSVIIMIARSMDGLQVTKDLMNSKNLEIKLHSMDLLNCNEESYKKVFSQLNISQDVKNALIFHNAGSLGKVGKAVETGSKELWSDFLNLNVTSVAVLNAEFLKTFAFKAADKNIKVWIVNITSLFGREPFKSTAMYGTAKAARDFFFKVLALEEPDLGVLSYSPGPVDTEMLVEVEREIQDERVKGQFSGMRQEGKVLKPQQTIDKLFGVLKNGNFASGSVVDYFDS